MRIQVLRLYKDLLRYGEDLKYTDYTFFKRRVKGGFKSNKLLVDRKEIEHQIEVPKLNESDMEIQYTRGSGPGGQATNKTNNAVVIRHKPTGIVVKSHQTRSMWDNKKKAMEILLTKLDNLVNGQESIESQTKILLAKKSSDRNRKQKKLEELKAAFKQREGLE